MRSRARAVALRGSGPGDGCVPVWAIVQLVLLCNALRTRASQRPCKEKSERGEAGETAEKKQREKKQREKKKKQREKEEGGEEGGRRRRREKENTPGKPGQGHEVEVALLAFPALTDLAMEGRAR